MATATKTTTKKTAKTEDLTGPYAVILTGGKQYIVREGQYFKVEKLGDDLKEGDKITFDTVLLKDDGKNTTIGTPEIKGAKVEAEVMEQGRNKKITVIHYRSKSRHFVKKGHKQPYTQIRITKIA